MATETRASEESLEALWRPWRERPSLRPEVERHRRERGRYIALLGSHLAGARPGAWALEAGCGSAIESHLLAGAHPRARLVALDLAGGSLEVARRVGRETGARVHLVRADARHLPFREGVFSLLFSQGLLEHFPDPLPLLVEQARALAGEGLLVANVPQTFAGYTWMRRRRLRQGRWPWGWERSYRAGELMALGGRLGLTPVSRFGYGHWRSWGEPAWVLRDLYDKLDRRNPWRAWAPFRWMGRFYGRLWEGLEGRFGHLFCKDLVVSFRKKPAGGALP